MSALSTAKEGMLRKSHQGNSAKLNPRYFVSQGFHVMYFESVSMKTRHGRFDLRNVKMLRPASNLRDALEFVLQEDKKEKAIVVSFMEQPAEKKAWLTLWTSAVAGENVDPAFKEYRDEALAEKFNADYAEAAPLVSSVLKKQNSILTPRSKSGTALAAVEVKAASKEAPVTSQPQPSSAAALPASSAAAPPRSAAPPSALPPSATDDEDTFQITVPEGVQPGEKLKATTPSGVKVLLRVPEGAGPGTELNFTLPKGTSTSKVAELDADSQSVAAAKIQARIRGKAVRKGSKPSGAPPQPPGRKAKAPPVEQDDMTKAAVKVQSVIRGHSVRYEQEEVRRLEWMKYYMQPDVAEYDKAIELTCTPEEEQAVEDAKQENSRVQWMEYFVASGKLTEAKELGWDGKTPPPPGGGGGGGLCAVFAKCFGPSGGAGGMGGGGEETRKADFVKAVRNYEWDKATALARGAEETQDVADSKNRVEWMDYHTAQGDMEEALTYAITSEERMRVESATKQAQAKVVG